MNLRALRLVPLAAILATAALRADVAAAADPAPLPAAASPDGTVSEAAAISGPQDEAAIGDAVGALDADAGATPVSRLLQSLVARVAQPPRSQESGEDRGADRVPAAAGTQVAGILHGCPRALLGALLASAADVDDAVSALAIERETLALCRERQEIVNGIVVLEGELRELLTEVREETGAPGTTAGAVGSAEAPIVKVSAPVRVIEMPVPAPVTVETDTPPAPEPPSYSWFSILGTAGDLRAGVSGGARGGASVWFVREGDRLPGGVTVTRIVARPPGVHVGGAEAALPYRPHPSDATGPRNHIAGDGS